MNESKEKSEKDKRSDNHDKDNVDEAHRLLISTREHSFSRFNYRTIATEDFLAGLWKNGRKSCSDPTDLFSDHREDLFGCSFVLLHKLERFFLVDFFVGFVYNRKNYVEVSLEVV